jgi:hypothetical protein
MDDDAIVEAEEERREELMDRVNSLTSSHPKCRPTSASVACNKNRCRSLPNVSEVPTFPESLTNIIMEARCD